MCTTRGKPGKQVQKNGPVSTRRVSDTSDTDAVLTLSEAVPSRATELNSFVEPISARLSAKSTESR
jgi:hypothetical protein